MALTKAQKKTLLNAGFIYKEVYQLSSATGGDTATHHVVKQQLAFSSKPVQAMIRSRKNYIRNLKEIGWTSEEIKTKISSFYTGGKNIFQFLKLEYQPPRKLTDFQASVRLRARARISRVLGRAYGRRVTAQKRPMNLPKRPLYPNRPKLVRRVRRYR